MKSKKSIYILLPVVLIIWGLIIYRFFSFSNTEAVEEPANNNFLVKPLAVKPRDTIAINVHYRDPFLGKMYAPSAKIRKDAKSIKNVTPDAPLQWPPIIYKGIVSDTKNKKKVFMLIINGNTFLMSEKDKEQDITLKGGNRDFIEVTYKGAKNKIAIQP